MTDASHVTQQPEEAETCSFVIFSSVLFVQSGNHNPLGPRAPSPRLSFKRGGPCLSFHRSQTGHPLAQPKHRTNRTHPPACLEAQVCDGFESERHWEIKTCCKVSQRHHWRKTATEGLTLSTWRKKKRIRATGWLCCCTCCGNITGFDALNSARARWGKKNAPLVRNSPVRESFIQTLEYGIFARKINAETQQRVSKWNHFIQAKFRSSYLPRVLIHVRARILEVRLLVQPVRGLVVMETQSTEVETFLSGQLPPSGETKGSYSFVMETGRKGKMHLLKKGEKIHRRFRIGFV